MSTPQEEKKEPSFLWKYRGFLLTLISSFTFSISSLLIKYLKDVSPLNVALWRFQGSFLPAIPLMIFNHIRSRKQKPQNDSLKENVESIERSESSGSSGKFRNLAFVLLRSILACNALVLHFYSLKYLDLGDALVIFSSTPIFAYALAHFFLREPCGLVPALTSFTTLIGVVVIIEPPILTGEEEFDLKMLEGAGIAMTSMLLSTASYIALRRSRDVHYSATMFIFGSWCTIENLILALALGILSLPNGLEEWILAASLALITFIGEIAMIFALKSEQTGPFAIIRSLDVIFGFIGQMLVWHRTPDIYSLVGAGIVILGVIIAAFRKYIDSLPKNDEMRKRCWFILK